MIIYIEDLNIFSIVTLLIKVLLKKKFRKSVKKIYYIYPGFISQFLVIPFLKILKIKIEELEFSMMEVRDEKGEIVRQRITQVDLFQIEKKIINSKSYQHLIKNSQAQVIEEYILKGIIAFYNSKNSVFRILYLINVIFWKNNNNKISDSIFLINKRPWKNLYKEYALNLNINIITNIFDLSFNENLIKKIKLIIKDIYFKFFNFYKEKKFTNNYIKLYCEGRGDVNLQNNGYHSDFFWLFNSSFPANKVLYHCQNDYAKKNFR